MEERNNNTHPKSVALVVGVTGMAGLGIAEALKSPSAQSGPWKVYGTARRPKPAWFPSSLVDQYISFDALDLADTESKLSPIASQITHVFWVALHVAQHEEEVIASNFLMLANVLKAVTTKKKKSAFANSTNKVLHITLQTGTKHYLGPVLSKSELVPHESPFHEDMERLPYPNFYYALEDIVRSYGPDLTYSIHRPSIIVGASTRSAYNVLLTLAVYAEICKHQNVSFKYPGSRYTWEHFCDMTDARVLADQHVWAATNAKNQAFNCTNGDVFTWKRMWEVLCEEFGVEFQPLDDDDDDHGGLGFDLGEVMKDKGSVWDQIVEEKGLVKTKMEEITCFAALQIVFNFKVQNVSSMNKSKEFGFMGFVDSVKSVRFWITKLREMNIIP